MAQACTSYPGAQVMWGLAEDTGEYGNPQDKHLFYNLGGSEEDILLC